MATLELNGMHLAEDRGGGLARRLAGRTWMAFKTNPNRFLGRALLAAWTGFWTWFCVMDAASEGIKSVLPAAMITAGVWLMALVGFRWPRLAAVVLLGGAGVSAAVFPNGWAWALFSAPLAVAAMLIPWERR